jgi:hypothetical protein
MTTALAVVDSILGQTAKDPVQTNRSKQGRLNKKLKPRKETLK